MRIERVGVRQLKVEATRLVRAVYEQGAEYVVTIRGRPVAVIRPWSDTDVDRLRRADIEAHLAELEALAAKVGAAWQSSESGVALVEQQRRG